MTKKINITFWEENTPEFVLACFFNCWQKKDFRAMQNYCQKYWLEGAEDPEKMLEDRFDMYELSEVLYIQESPTNENNGLNKDVVIDLVALVVMSNKKGSVKKKIIPRLIKETDECTPSALGTWGVNPISTMRTLNREKKKKWIP